MRRNVFGTGIIFLACLLGGCNSMPRLSLPSGSDRVPVNRQMFGPAGDRTIDAAKGGTAATDVAASKTLSSSEVPVFRGLDPDRFEALTKAAN